MATTRGDRRLPPSLQRLLRWLFRAN